MRIIGGTLRGRYILPPKGFNARPTTDFAKEGLFNTLANKYDFSEISVLDLFSGTGGISYEFASRGCPAITSVEMNPLNSRFIKETTKKFGFKSINPVRHNVFDFIKICRLKFDLIFADPPYNITDLALIPDKILNAQILNPQGIFILEHPATNNFSQHPNFQKEKKYGNVHFTFFNAVLSVN